MAQEVAGETATILSEEDLQRAIELEAWCDWDPAAAARHRGGRVEADTSASIDLGIYSEENFKLLWNVDENEGDLDFGSSGKQPHSYNDIVKDLMTQLAEVEGSGYTDEIEISPTLVQAQSRVEADSGEKQTGDPMLDVAKKPKYCHIALEILTTERTYVKGLSVVVKTMRSIHDRKILSESERKEIFLNIGKICALNLDLLRELEMRFLDWNPNTRIVDTIVKRASFFKFYSTYAESYEIAQKAYIQKLGSSKQFRKLITETESDLSGNKFASFMILPIQRVLRYKLLLEDYLKHLPDGHPDEENANDALTVISQIANDMDCKVITADWESQALMLKVSRLFIDGAELLAPGRKFIGRGPVTFAPSDRKEERILFLFSDILVVASFAAHDQTHYQIDEEFKLRTLLVKALEDTSAMKNAFCIAIEHTKKLYRFGTGSVDERNKWIEKLKIGRVATSDQYAVNPAFEHAAKLKDSDTFKKLENLLSLLDDPSFEQTQPSWVRRSRNKNSSTLLSSGTEGVDNPYDAVDHPIMKGVKETMEDIKMEFEDEGKRSRALLIMSLKPGIDNSLSSYMNMRSPKLGNVWTRRWFVLTNQSLICYSDHLQDEQMGAIPLAGYKLSIPTADEEEKDNVLKLTHPKCPVFFFEFPCTYDFERWEAILRELLESDINSC